MLAAAGAGNVHGGPTAIQKRLRPHIWQDSPAFPEPNLRPVWANGRMGTPPLTAVEAAFRGKYHAQALPAPLEMSNANVEGVREMLAAEPSPSWALGREPSGQHGGCRCGGAKPSRPRRSPGTAWDASRPNTRGTGYSLGEGRASPALQAAALSAVVDTRPHSARAGTAGRNTTSHGQRQPSVALAPPWVGQVDNDHNQAGIHKDVIPGLAERLGRLVVSRQSADVFVWILIESCRDCANHDASLRHDEAVYQGRYQQLKETIESKFPSGIQVELLAPHGDIPPQTGQCNREPTYRIGSFEVYMCSANPMNPLGAAPLGSRRGASSFNGVCLASKLKSRSWPSVETVLKRIATSMPRLPVKVSVRTELDFPLPLVVIKASNSKDNEELVAGETDSEGVAMIGLPMFTPLRLQAGRASLMEGQQKDIEIVSPQDEVHFSAETVVQLWQMETSKELAVFCSSPWLVSNKATGVADGLVPFQGQLECETGEAVRPDVEGFIRGRPDPLADADLITCSGWRSCSLDESARQIHGTGRVIEIGRLQVPIVEVSLITCCCAAAVPGARILVDGETFGTTDESGVPLSCGLRAGQHKLIAQHLLLSPQGLVKPITISGATTCGEQVELPLDRLRFVCAAAPRGNAQKNASQVLADLWLVGGDLAQWRCSRGAPPMDAEVWLWDGELQASACGSTSPRPLRVQAGVLGRNALAGVSAKTDQTSGTETALDDGEELSCDDVEHRPSGTGFCAFSDALASPRCAHGPWQVVLHMATPPAGSECAITRLARLATGAAPALWLARLAIDSATFRSNGEPPKRQLAIKTTCCEGGACGVRVSVDGQEAGKTNEDGELNLSCGTSKCKIGLEGIPPCLLPGGTNQFIAHLDATERGTVDLHVACLIWIYWVPPDEPDLEAEDGDIDNEDGLVYVCIDSDQIPDEARPLAGLLRCDGAEESEIRMDGRYMGPVLLRPARAKTESHCLISEVSFDAEAPHGYMYLPKNPSPLAERQRELGGCEMQRLMHGVPCVAIGSLKRDLDVPALPVAPPQWTSNELYVDDGSPEDAGLDHYQNSHYCR